LQGVNQGSASGMGHEPAAGMDVRRQFQEAGFAVEEVRREPEALAVKKNNCTQLLERNPKGQWSPSGPPTFDVRGLDCELEDRGYQKFWLHLGRRFPVRVNDLRTLHHFDQEVRTVLGITSLYHQSLGTTSARSAYDRLDGRPDQ
jgi:hypothetical protein